MPQIFTSRNGNAVPGVPTFVTDLSSIQSMVPEAVRQRGEAYFRQRHVDAVRPIEDGVIGVVHNVDILRVHDVRENVEAIRLARAVFPARDE